MASGDGAYVGAVRLGLVWVFSLMHTCCLLSDHIFHSRKKHIEVEQCLTDLLSLKWRLPGMQLHIRSLRDMKMGNQADCWPERRPRGLTEWEASSSLLHCVWLWTRNYFFTTSAFQSQHCEWQSLWRLLPCCWLPHFSQEKHLFVLYVYINFPQDGVQCCRESLLGI